MSAEVINLPPSATATMREYIAHGWQLCAIPPGSKGPVTENWNLVENALKPDMTLPAGWGVGLMHAYSGTCALDIDDIEAATAWLKARQIDLHGLLADPAGVRVVSGNPGHDKLLYALPGWLSPPLQTKKVVVEGKTLLELRCASAEGASVQDVLPPSVHPGTGKPYTWAGDWRTLPVIPADLLDAWLALIDEGQQSKGEQSKPMTSSVLPVPLADLPALLSKLDANCDRQTWIEVGMGIRAEYGDEGFAAWDEWSRKSPEKYKQHEQAGQWKSFKDRQDGIGFGTVIKHAVAAGWKPPQPDVNGLFGEVPPPPPPPAGWKATHRGWDGEEWPDPHNPFADEGDWPQSYVPGNLPPTFERMTNAMLAFFPNASAELYAGLFLPAVCAHVPATVSVQQKHGDETFKPMGASVGLVDHKGKGKTPSTYATLGTAKGGPLEQLHEKTRYRARQDNARKHDEMEQAKMNKQIWEGKFHHPAPLLNSISIEGLTKAIESNVEYNTATTFVAPELYTAFSGGSHHESSYQALSDPMKSLMDGDPFTKKLSKEEITFPSCPFNLVFNSTFDAMAEWKHLKIALADGQFSRISFFSSGRPTVREKADVLDKAAVEGWRLMQNLLQTLLVVRDGKPVQVKLTLARCPEVEADIADLGRKLSHLRTETGFTGWLRKMTEADFPKLAAAIYLTSAFAEAKGRLEAAGGNEVFIEIPPECQRRAWAHLNGFVREQQRAFHIRVQGMTEAGEWLRHYAEAFVRKGMTEATGDDIYGKRAMRSMRYAKNREREHLIDVLFMAGFISPWCDEKTPGKTKWADYRRATRFDINPKLHAMLANMRQGFIEANKLVMERMEQQFGERRMEKNGGIEDDEGNY